MKLRINGNSIRLRLLRSEVAAFIDSGEVEETIRFAAENQALWAYSLKHDPAVAQVEVRYEHPKVTVVVPKAQAIEWARSEQTGIYSAIDFGKDGSLNIMIEKDFACLDLSDAENQDTFANPQGSVAC